MRNQVTHLLLNIIHRKFVLIHVMRVMLRVRSEKMHQSFRAARPMELALVSGTSFEFLVGYGILCDRSFVRLVNHHGILVELTEEVLSAPGPDRL